MVVRYGGEIEHSFKSNHLRNIGCLEYSKTHAEVHTPHDNLARRIGAESVSIHPKI